ncbi:MAG: RiPP maturation radical SAM C-methyltransferase [Deltaproteobacteria bacterium]|nr:RiPP maturation radical SAM C-methyltransferase [Deltaproteobacteria bacterium]
MTANMRKRVLLVNMPFVSVRYPSPALSLLKSILEGEGLSCDVSYLNIIFQDYSGRPNVYEGISDLMIVGEWIFGEALFGKAWAQSERGRFEAIDGPLLPDGLKGQAARDALTALRTMAGSFIRKCMETLPWDDYGIIGFTSVYSQQVAALALAHRIKERFPEKIIAFGGANCEEVMGITLLRLFPFVDWVFNGEADLSFPRAVAQWFGGTTPQGIPGVAYRHDGQIVDQGAGPSPEMDRLPYPDFDDYFTALNQWAPDYRSHVPISLELSRGCWWGKKSQCIFCGLNCTKLNFRRKNHKRAEDEIKTLTARYKVDKVILTDSILDMSFFKTLLPALADWGGLAELFLEAKANLNCDQVGLLKSAGVTHFQPGIESLDTEILTLMRKGITLLQNIQFLKCAREYAVYPTWNLLYGFPGENAEAYQRMAGLVPSIAHLCPPIDLSPVLLVRFSPLFEESRAWGLKDIRAHPGYQAIYPFNQEDLDGLAYFFDYDHDGKENISTYIAPLKQQIQNWKQSWAQSQPPALVVEQQPGGKIFIHDTRPCRKSHREELEGVAAMAYLFCDKIRPFEALAKDIRVQMGNAYAGDVNLRRCLDEFIARRLMLGEEDRYLSLAMKPAKNLDVSEEW